MKPQPAWGKPPRKTPIQNMVPALSLISWIWFAQIILYNLDITVLIFLFYFSSFCLYKKYLTKCTNNSVGQNTKNEDWLCTLFKVAGKVAGSNTEHDYFTFIMVHGIIYPLATGTFDIAILQKKNTGGWCLSDQWHHISRVPKISLLTLMGQSWVLGDVVEMFELERDVYSAIVWAKCIAIEKKNRKVTRTDACTGQEVDTLLAHGLDYTDQSTTDNNRPPTDHHFPILHSAVWIKPKLLCDTAILKWF